MIEREALKLAMEALKYPLNQSHENFNVDMAELLAHRAITAIKEALAQLEQEPRCEAIIEVFGKDWRLDYMSLPVGKHKLYTQQYTYTTPPQREPLTDERVFELIEKHTDWYPAPGVWRLSEVEFARAIEAAHGIK